MTSDKLQVHIAKTLKFSLVITSVISISGCGLSALAFRDTNPVIQDHATPALLSFRRTNVFATTASRRLAIVTEDSKGNLLTCAEPPPDVGEAFASAIAAGLQAAGTATHTSGEKISAELATQYGRAVATQIAPLLYRTQGLQLYRDSMYKLCIDRMNGWIDQTHYDSEKKGKFEEAMKLINAELPIMGKAIETFYTNVKAGEAKVNVDDIVKILAIQNKAPSPASENKNPGQ